MFGLSDNTINSIKNIFSKYKQVEKVVIYGSRAKGNYRKGSDIDLSFFGKNINRSILHKIEENIEELYLPYIFDMSIYKQIVNKNLIEHIVRVGKEFYVKKSKQKSSSFKNKLIVN